MGNTSTAQISASLVLEACDRYLAARQAYVDERTEVLVQKEMSRTFFAAKTREKALERLEEAIRDIKWVGGYWPACVRQIKTLAITSLKQGDGYVKLTTDDANLLEGYWK